MFDDYEAEKADALAQEAMTDGEYHSASLAQFAAAHGSEDLDSAWILSPFDTWERNPHYTGDDFRHPEDDSDREDPDAAEFVSTRDADGDIPF